MLTSMCVFRLYYANVSVKYGTAALIATFPPSTLKMWQWRMSLIEIWIVSHCVNSETGDDKSILSVRASVVSLFLFITVSLTPALFPLCFFFCLSTCWYYEGGEGWNGRCRCSSEWEFRTSILSARLMKGQGRKTGNNEEGEWNRRKGVKINSE